MVPHRCHQPPRVSLQGDSHSPRFPASLPTHPSKAHHHLCPAPKVSCIQPPRGLAWGLGEAGWVPRSHWAPTLMTGEICWLEKAWMSGLDLGDGGPPLPLVGLQYRPQTVADRLVIPVPRALSSFTPSMPGLVPDDPGASVCHRHPCLLLQATKAVSIPSRTASPMLTATGPLSQQPPGMDWWATPMVLTPCDPTPTPASAHLYLHQVSFPKPPFPEHYQGCVDFIHSSCLTVPYRNRNKLGDAQAL